MEIVQHPMGLEGKIRIGFDVSYNSELWRIVDNNTVYKLMPHRCIQNNGLPIEVGIDTVFDAVYPPMYLHFLNKITTLSKIIKQP